MTAVGHILRVPTREYARNRGEERWCFACRKRLAGWNIMHVPVDPMSYYGPHWSYECDGCHKDRRLGFGMEWIPADA